MQILGDPFLYTVLNNGNLSWQILIIVCLT